MTGRGIGVDAGAVGDWFGTDAIGPDFVAEGRLEVAPGFVGVGAGVAGIAGFDPLADERLSIFLGILTP